MYQQAHLFQTIRQHNEEWMLRQRHIQKTLEFNGVVSECYQLRDEYNSRQHRDDEWEGD
jgi:hypothetical protein